MEELKRIERGIYSITLTKEKYITNQRRGKATKQVTKEGYFINSYKGARLMKSKRVKEEYAKKFMDKKFRRRELHKWYADQHSTVASLIDEDVLRKLKAIK